MKIILAGKQDRAVVCLKALLENNYQVIEVITPKNDPKGFWYPSLSETAQKNKLPIFAPDNINTSSSIEHLRKLRPDIVILSGYTQIIKKPLLSIPSYGFINLHGGKLPEYRGSSTLNWMIINGETEGGISIIKVDEGIDTGPILGQEKFPIKQTDTIVDVVNKTLKLFPELLLQVLKEISKGTIREEKQNPEEGSYYHSRKPEDGRIFWHEMNDKDVYNLIRALIYPYPGAFCFYKTRKLLCWKAEILNETIKGIPGRIAKKTDKGIAVVCKNRAVLLTEIQFENQKRRNPRELFSIGENLS